MMYEGGAAQKLNKMHANDIHEEYDSDKYQRKIDEYMQKRDEAEKRGDTKEVDRLNKLIDHAWENVKLANGTKHDKKLAEGRRKYFDTTFAQKRNYKPSEGTIDQYRREKDRFLSKYGGKKTDW